MALHNIKIIVVDGGRAGSYKARNTGTNSEKKNGYKDSPLYKLLNLKETIKNKVKSGISPAGVMAFNMGSQIAGQIVKQTANYYISDIGRKNGDSNYQQNINRQIEVITDGAGILNGALSGAATGSMFGPIGAAMGAVTGLATSAISLSFRQMERNRAYQHEIFKENNSQTYNLARTSYQGFTGRLR